MRIGENAGGPVSGHRLAERTYLRKCVASFLQSTYLRATSDTLAATNLLTVAWGGPQATRLRQRLACGSMGANYAQHGGVGISMDMPEFIYYLFIAIFFFKYGQQLIKKAALRFII